MLTTSQCACWAPTRLFLGTVLLQVCSQDLLLFAQDKFQVKFTPGHVCDGQAHMIRLSFAFYREQELQTGAQRLGAAIRAYLKQ